LQEKAIKQVFITLATTMVATTPQLEGFFSYCGSPKKRASEALRELEEDGFVEGQKNRPMGRAKVWRLSKKGRDYMSITRRPIALQSNKLSHHLEITDSFLQLSQTEELKYFEIELREHFIDRSNKIKKYCPDAFFIFNGIPYLLEVQRSPLSSLRWKAKWDVALEFFESGMYKHASWQKGSEVTQPHIVVISNQRKDVVLHGCRLPVVLVRQIRDII
jgi:DNA-binding MarR family transcriptional regulator